MALEWCIALAVLIVAIAAERLHARRIARLAPLVLGRSHRFTWLAAIAPYVRSVSLAAIAWAAVVLLVTSPAHWMTEAGANITLDPHDLRRLLIVLDVSPSMGLKDAGDDKEKRSDRAAAVLDNALSRIDLSHTRVSVVAFYTAARPVVIDAVDPALIHYLATEATLDRAFDDGDTDMITSVNSAMDVAREWRPDSATMLLITDGDAASKTTLNALPTSINQVLIAGVGDRGEGSFIDGHMSRQDGENLADLAQRLGGTYFDANTHFVPSNRLEGMSGVMGRTTAPPLDRRTVALIAFATGAAVLTLLPITLSLFGMASRMSSITKPARQLVAGGVR